MGWELVTILYPILDCLSSRHHAALQLSVDQQSPVFLIEVLINSNHGNGLDYPSPIQNDILSFCSVQNKRMLTIIQLKSETLSPVLIPVFNRKQQNNILEMHLTLSNLKIFLV